MKNFLKYSMICWAPDGSGAAGDEAAAAAAAAAAKGGGNNDAPITDPAKAAADAAAAAAAAGTAKWWDDLDPALKGTDEATTKANVKKLAGDLKGYRDRDATRNVPQTPEGYLNFDTAKDFKIDDKNKVHFETLKTDPAFKAIAVAGHKHGVSQTALMDMYQSALNVMGEQGMLEMPLDANAEKALLVPEAAKNLPKAEQDTAVLKRINENYDFLTLMQTNKGLPKEVSDHAEMMLGDSAKGHQFLEWVRGLVQGGAGGPGAHGAGGGGSDTKESLQAEMAAIEKNPGDPKYREKMAALDEKYKKLYGD